MYLRIENLTDIEIYELKQNIITSISSTKTASQAARLLNLDYKKLRRLCEKLNIELIKNQSKKGIIDENGLNDILNNKKHCKSDYLKKLLFKTNQLEEKCSICGITEWNNSKITLHLDHIDGDHFNNNFDNLRILCPNCHSQTDTYCRQKSRVISDEEYINAANKSENIHQMCNVLKLNDGRHYDIIKKKIIELNIIFNKKDKPESIQKNYCSCGKEITKYATQCEECWQIKQRKVERPSYEILKKEVEENGYSSTGRKYGVSDKTISKWLKSYEKQI